MRVRHVSRGALWRSRNGRRCGGAFHLQRDSRFDACRERSVSTTWVLNARGRKKRGWANLKRLCDLAQVDHGHVVLASFDPAHVGPVNTREISQSFLRNTLRDPRASDRIAKRDEDRVFCKGRRRFCHSRHCLL